MAAHYFSNRKDALGALLDLQDKVITDFKELLETISSENYLAIKDSETEDEDCRSIQTICNHMLNAGYYYLSMIQTARLIAFEIPKYRYATIQEVIEELDVMQARYDTCLYQDGSIDRETLEQLKVTTRQGRLVDMEDLLEHSVIHIMRHHRQVERLLN